MLRAISRKFFMRVVDGAGCGRIFGENYSGLRMSPLPKQGNAQVEAQRDVGINGTAGDTDAAIPLRGLRPAVRCVCLADRHNAIPQ